MARKSMFPMPLGLKKMNSASKDLPGSIRILSGDDFFFDFFLVFHHFESIFHPYGHADDFKIIPGDLRQALDQRGPNPGRSLDEGRMTPRWR